LTIRKNNANIYNYSKKKIKMSQYTYEQAQEEASILTELIDETGMDYIAAEKLINNEQLARKIAEFTLQQPPIESEGIDSHSLELKSIIDKLPPDPNLITGLGITDNDGLYSEQGERLDIQKDIGEWIEAMPMTVHTWLPRDREVPREFMGGSYGNQYTTLSSQPGAIAFKANRAMENLREKANRWQKGLREKGIFESITMVPISGSYFGELSKKPSKFSQEDAMQILYETAPSNWMHGNFLRLGMVLPKTETTKLMETVEKHPAVMREIADRLMREKFKSKEGWEKCKPPYEAVKVANGGVNKMLLRTDIGTDIDQCSVLEF
jgi:hypothetical protein